MATILFLLNDSSFNGLSTTVTKYCLYRLSLSETALTADVLLSEPGEQDVDRGCFTRQDGDSQLSAQTPTRSAQIGAVFHPEQTLQSNCGHWSPRLANVLPRFLYKHSPGKPDQRSSIF